MDVQKPNERGRGRPKKGREYDADSLFEAAVACFAEQGFDKASLRTIAVRAGVDVALISYRYGSKLGLWAAVVDAVAQEALDQLAISREESRHSPSDEQLHRLCIDLVHLVNRRPLFAQILISEIMTSADNERKTVIEQKLANPIYGLLLKYIMEIRGEENSSGKDVQLVVISAISLIAFIVPTRTFLRRFVPIGDEPDRLLEEIADIVKQMLT
jgi:AcrR family transcriptional regulator